MSAPAVAVGLNLALSADLRIVNPAPVLVSGFVRVGAHPGGGHLHMLTRAGGVRSATAAGVFAHPITAPKAVTGGLSAESVTASEIPQAVARATEHLAVDPSLACALGQNLRRTARDPGAWDGAVEIERARQGWSLSRPRPHARQHPAKES